MAEMNTSPGPGERWGIETPASTVEAGLSAIGRVAQSTREKVAGSVEGVDPKRLDVRAILDSAPTPVELRTMNIGGDIGDELGDILPDRTERPGFVSTKLQAMRPDIDNPPLWN